MVGLQTDNKRPRFKREAEIKKRKRSREQEEKEKSRKRRRRAALERSLVTWSWEDSSVKGFCHGLGIRQLKIYKKNFVWVFLSTSERFWPRLTSLYMCLLSLHCS